MIMKALFGLAAVATIILVFPALAASDGRYTINTPGSVTDNVTGLIWQQCYVSDKHWDAALAYCEDLYWAGFNDWRLPNIKELESLVDKTRSEPAINTDYFEVPFDDNYGIIGGYFWSSSSRAQNPTSAWGVDFGYGYVSNFGKSASYYYIYARCVRGGL